MAKDEQQKGIGDLYDIEKPTRASVDESDAKNAVNGTSDDHSDYIQQIYIILGSAGGVAVLSVIDLAMSSITSTVDNISGGLLEVVV